MSDSASARVVERLRRADLGPLVDELARRFGAGEVPVFVSLRDAPADTLRAIADLLGIDRLPGRRVRVERIARQLGLDEPGDLRGAVEALRGPLGDRRAERAAARLDRDELWSWLAAEVARLKVGDLAGRLDGWVDAQRAHGARGGVATHRARLEAALAVLRALPADGVSLAGLATDRAGQPHALDHGTGLATLVLDAVAIALGVARPGDAEAARQLWEAVGVAPDALSSTVLTFGLPGGTESPLRRWLADATQSGEPVVLSLANLRRWPLPPLPAHGVALVLENPSLVAEAATGGWPGPPLVCSSGRPTVAVVTLLRQLRAAGATLHQHADFDPAGLAITRWLADRAGTVPWGMTAATYRAALARLPARLQIDAPVPDTPWDPDLAAAMRDAAVPVFEEDLRADLLGDLHGLSPRTPPN